MRLSGVLLYPSGTLEAEEMRITLSVTSFRASLKDSFCHFIVAGISLHCSLPRLSSAPFCPHQELHLSLRLAFVPQYNPSWGIRVWASLLCNSTQYIFLLYECMHAGYSSPCCTPLNVWYSDPYNIVTKKSDLLKVKKQYKETWIKYIVSSINRLEDLGNTALTRLDWRRVF